jgi:hypothetical protein
MPNFPYNHHRHNRSMSVNGCPISYKEARELAYQVQWWHIDMGTDSWTQSRDDATQDQIYLAFGLMEILSDPGAIRRLIMSGEVASRDTELLLNSDYEPFAEIREVVGQLFEADE